VPLVLLFFTGPPLRLIEVPREWLADRVPVSISTEGMPEEAAKAVRAEFERADKAASDQARSRLIGVAMLVGVVLTALVGWETAGETAKAFFEGAGYAVVHIISLIVTASAFGEGVKLIGLDKALGWLLEQAPGLLIPAAGAMPCGFGLISGSGMAATQSLYQFFVKPAETLGVDPKLVGAVVSLGAAAGRTMSPVAAVALMCASLTETDALSLARRVAVPLLVGLVVVVVVAVAMAAW
jgi:DcuC family C4-dicarboxylate transporter